MKEAAIQQSKARLRTAKSALAAIRDATTFSVLEEGWSQFLIATNLTFMKLRAGSKGCPISEAWIAQRTQERDGDELLSYLHQARNAEEHGIDCSVQNGYKIEPVPGVTLHVDATFEPNGDVIFRRQDDPSVLVFFPLTGALKEIADRRGRTVGPPTSHLGQAIEPTARTIAGAATTYLDDMIVGAEALPLRK